MKFDINLISLYVIFSCNTRLINTQASNKKIHQGIHQNEQFKQSTFRFIMEHTILLIYLFLN